MICGKLNNFGARRLRASKLAGLTEIPAFIDTTAENHDQVIGNEQREGLKPLEIALFVQGARADALMAFVPHAVTAP